jgi:hypothetical protein
MKKTLNLQKIGSRIHGCRSKDFYPSLSITLVTYSKKDYAICQQVMEMSTAMLMYPPTFNDKWVEECILK